MPSFEQNIRPHVQHEFRVADAADAEGDAALAFAHLERAHVLGQASTTLHVLSHWRMLGWALRQRDAAECFGQLVRIVGAATKTAIGLVPTGTTGGSDISPFKRLPLAPDLAAILRAARSRVGAHR